MKVLVIFLFGIFLAVLAQKKPEFSVMAPNILCSKETRNPQTFTINLVPAEGQHLNYNIQVNYEYSIPKRNQRHSLGIWQTIRQLEQQFGRNRISINSENKIDIATSMLTPGVIYTFVVEAEDEAGNRADVQRFSLDYKEGNLFRMCQTNDRAPEFSLDEIVENLSSNDHSWIKIIGPTETYANLPLILDAKVQFIGNVNEYFIKWKISGYNSSNVDSYRGSNLVIPAYELEPGREYVVHTELADAGNSNPVAFANHTIAMKFHQLIVDLEPAEVLAGPGRRLEFEVHIRDFNREISNFQVEWRCVAQQSDSLCNGFPPPHGEKISLAFVQPGRYQLQAIVVNQDNLTDMETALIEIRPDIVARAKLIALPSHPTDVTKWIKGQAQIDYVVPKCTAKWILVEQEGYAYTDLTSLGGHIGSIIVNDFESNFLADLADFSNKTVSKLVNLRIPPAHFYPNWSGLQPDVKYKLRLNIECPAPLNENDPHDHPESDTVNSYLDIDLDTNSPPSNTILSLTPTDGTALSTQFKFKAAGTVDKDGPLLFSYGFELMNQSVILRQGYGLTSMESILPSGMIHTFCHVCDIYNACSTTFGPIVVVEPSNIDFDTLRLELDKIESHLDRMEYRESINKIFMYGISLQKGDDPKLYSELYTNVIQLIRAETKRLLKSPEFLSNEERFEYIKNVKKILETLDIKNNEIVRDLMKLLEMVVDDEEIHIERDIKRRKRQTVEERSQSITADDVINSYKDLIDRLVPDDNAIFPIADAFVKYLCAKADIKQSVQFNYSIQLMRAQNLETALKFIDGPTVYLKDKSDPLMEYCIGLVYDEKTAHNTEIYQVIVASRNKVKQSLFDRIEIKEIDIETTTDTPSNCMILVNTTWQNCPSSQNETIIHCSCERNAPFRITGDGTPRPTVEIITPTTTTTILTSTSTPATTPTTTTQSNKEDPPTTLATTTLATAQLTPETPVEATTVTRPSNETAEFVLNADTGATIEKQTTSHFASAVGYTALAVLGIGIALGVVSFYLYRHNQKKNSSFALDLQAIAAEARAQIPGIRYSRFHDENTMRGDSNVYTMG